MVQTSFIRRKKKREIERNGRGREMERGRGHTDVQTFNQAKTDKVLSFRNTGITSEAFMTKYFSSFNI